MLNPPEEGDAADVYDGPSKSQRKRDSDALQALGKRLVALSADRLKKIAMPDNLREAIADAQRFTAHGAHRRQMQLIGKIMRSVDPAPLQAALDEIDGVSAAATARLHQIEQWRDRLLANDAAFADLAAAHPGGDLQHLRQLRRNAVKEAALGKPARSARELFRELRALIESPQNSSRGAAAVDGGNLDDRAGDDTGHDD